MSAIVDKLKKALAQASGYSRQATSSVPVRTGRGGDHKRLADTIYAAFAKFTQSPDVETARHVVQVINDAMTRYDPATVAQAILAVRNRLNTELLARAFDLLAQGRVDDAVKLIQNYRRAELAEQYASRLGVPVEIVMETMDEKGKIKVDLLASIVKARASKLLGLAESGMLTPKKFHELVKDIRAGVKVGSAVSGERFFTLLEKVSKAGPTAVEAEKVVEIAKAAVAGDDETLRTLHEMLGRKAKAGPVKPIEEARKPVVKGENLAAKAEAARFARMMDGMKVSKKAK